MARQPLLVALPMRSAAEFRSGPICGLIDAPDVRREMPNRRRLRALIITRFAAAFAGLSAISQLITFYLPVCRAFVRPQQRSPDLPKKQFPAVANRAALSWTLDKTGGL